MSEEKAKLAEPSDHFKNAVSSSGSIVIQCELCGRTHFGDGSGDYEPGELEKLLEKAAKEPDKYIQHGDDDMVSYGYIQGRQAVLDCPCHELRKYEDFIWKHRHIISRYLKTRIRDNLEIARIEADEVAGIPTDLCLDRPPKRKFDLP